MKGKGKGQGCFLCGDPNHWSKECPKGKGRMSALTEEQQGSGAEWYDEWNHWSPDDWSNDDWSWEEQDWNGEWIGSVDDWSGALRLSHRARMVPRAQVRMSLRTPPRMNHHRMCQL